MVIATFLDYKEFKDAVNAVSGVNTPVTFTRQEPTVFSVIVTFSNEIAVRFYAEVEPDKFPKDFPRAIRASGLEVR